jgi:uncharacterized protein involved in tolerance to divalent cations
LSHFCLQDNLPLCTKCQEKGGDETANLHEGHYIKPLAQVVSQARDEYEQLIRDLKLRTEKIEAAVSYFGGLEEMFVWQKDIFVKKLNADFDVLIQTIEKKRKELYSKIQLTYDGHIDKAQNLQQGL